MMHLDEATLAQPVVVRPIETQAQFREFFEFPWVLYKDDPCWTPPLLSMRRELLDKEKNPAWEYMDGQYFGAWRGDTLVGTITGHVNHRHNEYWHENVGWFGTFEVYEDAEAATALLNTAAEWVRQQGVQAIRGPQSFTTHEETGLLVKNFEQPPVLLMPYNPPYYADFIEAAGFTKTMDLHSLYYTRAMDPEKGLKARLKKLADRSAKRSKITIRTLDPKRKKEEFRLFRDLYNDAWDKNWGFVPMTDRELDALVESLGMFVDPTISFFALVDGEPAGFALPVPDFNALLLKAYPRPGVPELWSLLKILWSWKVTKIINGVRLPLMGVIEKHRNKGVDLCLLNAVFQHLPMQYQYADCGWILETNDLVKISHKLGAESYKIHRLYEKPLNG